MKIAFIVQRCGTDMIGGAESLCLNLAEKLSDFFDIDILTTCAKDYVSWKNHYDEGIEILENIQIRRFKVDYERELKKFNNLSEKIYFQKHSNEEEQQWMKLQGPYSSDLFTFIENNKKNYDLFVFFTYLYASTFYGLPHVWSKSILVPQAHDELPLKLKIFDDVFQKCKGIIFQTKEEKELVEKRFNLSNTVKLIGQGVTDLEEPSSSIHLKSTLNFPYVLYLGRIDKSKGCDELIDYFLRYKKETQSNLKLVLVGSKIFDFKTNDDIYYLGILSEQEKTFVLNNSAVFIMPSQYESFSISTMEAWLSKKPVIVNGKCQVLKAHCKKSNGGLYYENYDEFSECLDFILKNKETSAHMGQNGFDYVKQNYTWKKIVTKYRDFFETIYEE